MRLLLRALPLFAVLGCAAPPPPPPAAPQNEAERWAQHAAAVTITRDDWGIAHVRGRTDADAVFGMMYAQAEDDFNRVETNYLNSMGRLAEAEGEREIWRDLRMKLFIDPDSMRTKYDASPAFLKTLMTSWADGLNYYLHTHPEVRPRVIRRFEPWMALSFSEGSIGGDIERVNLAQLQAFYETRRTGLRPEAGAPLDVATTGYVEPGGSNGFAIAPSNTRDRKALLLINPHTSFFFRSELQVTSDEGLNAYGAATWGQFFIYQGFNERVGWMHTSSGLDNVDEFLETVVERDGRRYYKYGTEERPLTATEISIPYRIGPGTMGARKFTVYKTHHGPIVREAGGRWVAIALMQRPVEALTQSWLRTKVRDFRSFRAVSEANKANSSNATIYADADGTIAYLHPQFVPRRSDKYDYSRPVDGSDPATDWQGLHTFDEAPQAVNPATGWVANTNNHPWTAAGTSSPREQDFPRYMDDAGENPRGLHYLRLLPNRRDFTLESLIATAYSTYLPAFAQVIPALVQGWDALPASDPLRARVAEPVQMLRGWDYRWAVSSVPTSLAVFFGEELYGKSIAEARRTDVNVYEYMATRTSPAQRVAALAAAVERLERDFGSWRTPWGEINRFQRLTGDIVQPFNDAAPSIPVGFTSAQWGSLASFGARPQNGSKRYYGTSGNSFVAAVEFGPQVRARAVSAGGESGDPRSKHFNDQADRYARGDLREVYFYPSQLVGHTERTYRPGERN